ncbi:hypothetical protein ACJRO7_013855 [Eucalyptus globulus]|uniref:Uncharacterized protein n=1 Tax=Eucalyptus globulus TaxID=34317 RepID=A0ABD3KZ96_EUCGL
MNSGCEASGTILSPRREYQETTVSINYSIKKAITMCNLTGLVFWPDKPGRCPSIDDLDVEILVHMAGTEKKLYCRRRPGCRMQNQVPHGKNLPAIHDAPHAS